MPVPRPRSAMRKIRELLRLHRGEGLSRRQAAIAAGMPYATAADHLARAQRAGIGWPLPEDMDERGSRRACSCPRRPDHRPSHDRCPTGPSSTASCAARA